MLRAAIVIGSLVLGASVVVAQQDLVNQTQTLMKGNGKNLATVLAPIAKGEKPYDQAAVDAALAQFEDTAKKLPTLFPASVKGLKPADSDYSSSPKIWENRADFDAHIASFAKAVADAKAKIKDLDTLKVSVQALGKECGGCHETFRLKNT
ncbi:cytochrome c556 [Rhodopseudomonas rhenobacensis]|uniref:Cytochrome c556 n=1 Tax=Rhodopseudomonas rhenobacensis TaxID=87461 RepID=A0A7W7Z3Z1_9BRAD|nr:cytochrome c [Rhodopseudomonas rhenobacensis]MBB5047587.1 cytochrome c556 [Rhodopseudomonas rhenobacensis]